MPSPSSTRPSGTRGRRSFVFVREDGETATDSSLLVGHHHRLDRRDQFATMVAFAIWLISLTLEVPRAVGARPLKDVAAAGGWNDVNRLLEIYHKRTKN